MKKFVAGLVVATSAGLLYAHLEIEAVKIGYTIQKQEQAKSQLVDRARALKYNIAKMKAPGNLERRLSARRVVLESPKTWQTLWVAPAESKIAQRRSFAAPLLTGIPISKLFIGTAQAESKDSIGR
ncbi:MAG: hypothetical protein WCG06_04245 [Candidatus Omnitrophota bacterium]